MDNASLEKRVAELEKEVAELKAEVKKPQKRNAWLDRAFGRFKDDPVYDEAMRLGAAWRRRENLKSIRELEQQGMIDADPRHRSSDSNRSSKRVGRKAKKASRRPG